VTLSAPVGRDREIVDPPAVAVVAAHHTRDDRAVDDADEEQPVPHRDLARDVPVRIVPRAREVARAPQRDDRIGVGRLELADAHGAVWHRWPPRSPRTDVSPQPQ
jgi:hypothetical protein